MSEFKHVKRTRKPVKRGIGALGIVAAIATILAQIAIGVFVFLSYKYYAIDFKIVLSALAVIICILIIIDILFYVGFKYRDKKIQIINIVLAMLLVVGGIVGSIYVNKVNSVVNEVIENTGTDQYETISGTFVYYKNNPKGKVYTSIDDLKNSTSTIKVGTLYDDGVGTGSLALKLLDENGVNYSSVTYNTNDDLLSALVGTDEDNVDIAVFPSSYRQRLSNDDNVDYSQYLDDMVDFYSFEEKTKTGENENANKDLSSEPFNILLIGFAPEDEAMTYGLADSIIVATVNPQTFTVAMTSIARDSFVPISCYGGSREKINAARGTSRQCLMDTVGDLLDLDIDYYMEVNFLGVVQIVDAVGGIMINNPVEFVGQTASGIRGEYTVLVPAGEYMADGEQALAFARERHAMPNGDFDRQQHQQQVIAEIVRKLLAMKDVNKALNVMEAAGNNMTTNLSLKQLTGVFNYLINSKNNTGLDAFSMIDIQNMRVTGYASWNYNYSMRLPLWIYKLYNGSIQEAKDRIADVMNEYSPADIKQNSYFKFFVEYSYNRGQLYSDFFNEAEEHEEMPAFYPTLTKYTYQEAMAWAASNGVVLNVTFIPEDSPNYVAGQAGYVVDQSPRQGALVSEWPVGSITVMGSGDPNYVPTFVVENCNDATSCQLFADNKGIVTSYEYKYFNDDSHYEGEFAGTNYVNGDQIKKDAILVIYTWKKMTTITIPSISGYVASTYSDTVRSLGFNVQLLPQTTSDQAQDGLIIATSCNGIDVTNGGVGYAGDTIIISYYSYSAPEPQPEPTPCENGVGTAGACTSCNEGFSLNNGYCVVPQPEPQPETPSEG